MAKRLALVDTKACVACGECITHCKKKAIHIMRGVYAYINEQSCVGCGLCLHKCPATAIKVGTVE